MKLPDFIIIGAMKSGTTTLHECLSRHKDIYMCEPKEPKFFSLNERYQNGINWYSSLFSKAEVNQICGESSTCYSRWPTYENVPERIHKYIPCAKFIFIVRHPVTRTYSHFTHSINKNERSYDSFRKAIESDPEFINSSKYMMQIDQYLNYFNKERFYFLKFEEFILNQKLFIREIQEFLGIDIYDPFSGELISENKMGSYKVRNKIIDKIRYIRRFPIISFVIDRLLSPEKRNIILKKIANFIEQSMVGKQLRKKEKKKIPKLLPEDRKFILNKCHSDTQQFELFSGLDLSDWYK